MNEDVMDIANSSVSSNSRTEEILSGDVDDHIQENLSDDLVSEALKSGVDLRNYSQQIEKELKEVENASIQDYIKESQNIATLHNQIASCDEILERMEKMLQTFQSDLGSISHEILNLQEQSISMNLKLKNRQAVRGELSQFVDDMIVPESMIYDILDKPVTEKDFIEQLFILDHKLTFVKEQSFKDARSCHDVKDCLEKLKIKAITKIREYLLQKIYQFRKPMTNYQIPQAALLKHKFFFKFLMANERDIAKEVRDEYIDTMSKIYYSYFKSYTSKLMKSQYEEGAGCDDLLGIEDTAKRSIFSTKPILKNKSTVFTVGNRGDVLTTELESPIIVPHQAQKNDVKYSFESLFRSQQFALVDNSCREYLFLKEFFMLSGNSGNDLFNSIMGKTLTMFLKHVDVYVQDCYDSIALFLCIHIMFRYEEIMQKRDIPCLEKFWGALLELFWPRLEYVLKINTQSIRDCDPRKLGNIDKLPHYVTRRYAELASVIVGINKTYPNERVRIIMLTLQEEVENFLLRMAAEFQERKDQLIFLINNYDLILSVLNERMKEESKESESFRDLLNSRTEDYVDEILSQYFGGMTSFVKEAEKVEGTLPHTELSRRDEKRVSDIIRLFSRDWKNSVESINQIIMTSFSNFKHGTNVLQAALGQLIQFYHRFQKILSMAPFKSLPARSELINIHHLMVEVKKYKSSF